MFPKVSSAVYCCISSVVWSTYCRFHFYDFSYYCYYMHNVSVAKWWNSSIKLYSLGYPFPNLTGFDSLYSTPGAWHFEWRAIAATPISCFVFFLSLSHVFSLSSNRAGVRNTWAPERMSYAGLKGVRVGYNFYTVPQILLSLGPLRRGAFSNIMTSKFALHNRCVKISFA